MSRKVMDILFPTLGIIRRGGLRTSSGGRGPFPTPWAINVRLEDGLTNRLRGGSFTGISAGSRPSSVYRDRTLQISTNVVECSRQGASADFNFSTDVSDSTRATFFQLAEATGTGPTVVAMAPHKDAYLVCWSASETWVLQGDPTTGGLRRVSDEVGIIGANAWCVAHDTVYFLSSRGLYSMGADGSGLKAISEDRIPEHLIGLSDTDCTLTYQHSDRGVYIHVTTDPDWFYDTARDGFWAFDTDTTDSHVLIGPFRLGQGSNYGRVLNLHGNIAASSDSVTWRIVTGDTAEAAAADGKSAIDAAVAGTSYSSYFTHSGTWGAGRAHMAYPRDRAIWCCLWIHGTGDWAFEQATMTAMISGVWR